MARAYSLDLREQVVAAIEGCVDAPGGGPHLDGRSWARLKRSQGDSGQAEASVLDARADLIRGVFEDKSDMTSTSWSIDLPRARRQTVRTAV